MELSELFDRIYTPAVTLTGDAYVSDEPLPFSEKETGRRMPVTEGVRWSDKRFGCAWFHLRCALPEACRGRHTVFLIDCGGEAYAYTPSGVPFKGLTNAESEFTVSLGRPAKRVIWDISPFQNGDTAEIWLDAGANDLFGNRCGVFREMRLAVCDDGIRQLYYDLEALSMLAEGDAELTAAVSELLGDPYAPGVREKAEKLLSSEGAHCLSVTAEGHAHIDLAWLWPVRETRRKALRTFSTVLRNAELYPEYIFGASQPQLLQWVKEDSPEVYEGLKKLYAQGRFEPQGIFWVECDANLPSGEALVRQAVYGKRFWEEEFGDRQEMCWLPDTFGYNAQLPQIIRKCGGKYFLTTKMSWNSVDRFPYSNFIWEGIDGSRVLSHIPPEGNYNSAASPRSLREVYKNFNEKGVSDRAMLLFGIGDGGGGPGMEHLERLKREKSLPGLPEVEQGTARGFFAALEKDEKSLPRWRGELYLEKHQGTYTTHAEIKRRNAETERMLALTETLCAAESRIHGAAYPEKELESAWKNALFLQFHDILPGSAIGRVYDEALAEYIDIAARLNAVCPKGESIFNPAPFAADSLTTIGGITVRYTAPAFGDCSISLAEGSVTAADGVLTNGLLSVGFGKDGEIISIFDIAENREVLSSPANIFRLFRDDADAWELPDIKSETPELFSLVSTSFVSGAIGRVIQEYRLGDTVIEAYISLAAGSRLLCFDISVELNTEHCMIRTAFPLDICAANAECGIPFGAVARPTHSNTSWDRAMKEVCAQDWIDISEGSFGCAVLSPDIHGYNIKDNIIDINLIRNTVCPRDTVPTDTGSHRFRYALYPHAGNRENGGVVREALLFANPPVYGAPEYAESLASTDAENIVITAVKRAEDGKGLVIRMYESEGRSTRCALSVSPRLSPEMFFETDLTEKSPRPMPSENGVYALAFTPYEIKTVAVR